MGPSPGGSISAGKTNISSDYQSANEQSGLKAGDGGFQVVVEGHTDLKGGAITSTDKAVQEGLNLFDSGSLTLSDLNNSASYEAKGSNVSIGLDQGKVTGSPGVGSDSGNVSSTTQAAISDIAGNKDARTGDAETGIASIFDAEKVRQEIQAQTTITAAFVQQASQAVGTYTEQQRDTLREKAKQAQTEQERQEIQEQIDAINLQERVLNVLIGAVTGMAGSALAQEGLSAAADQMRQIMIEDSKKFPGVVDEKGNVLDNIAGPSDGVSGDGIKLGGTRVDLDALCGPANERCALLPDGSFDLKNGKIQFIAKDENGNPVSLQDFLKTPEGEKMAGPTGGVQGMKGTLFGKPYAAGSWQDKLIEAFAGPHDYIGGSLSGLYDEHGNATQGRSTTEVVIHDRWSEAAIPLIAPFAVATLLPREVWQAISVLLKGGK